MDFRKIIPFLGLILFLFGSQGFAKACEEKRAAIDFGSGTTKAYAALVDVCQKKILEVIYEERLPIAFNEAMEKSPQKEIPASLIKESLPALQELVEKIKGLGVRRFSAVATSVFRVAKKWFSHSQGTCTKVKNSY